MSVSYSAVTFSNYGYRDFTHNLLNSIKVNNVDLNPNVWTAMENFSHHAVQIYVGEDWSFNRTLANAAAHREPIPFHSLTSNATLRAPM